MGELCFSQNRSLFVSGYSDTVIQYAYANRPLGFNPFSPSLVFLSMIEQNALF